MTQQYKVNSYVWVKELGKRGKVKKITNDNPVKYLVEVIIKDNKQTGERTTILPKYSSEQLDVYREKKSKGRDMYNQMFYLVKEFQQAFGHPVADNPQPIESERLLNRQIWTAEELVEGMRMACPSNESFEVAVDTLIEGIKKAKDKSLKDDIPQTNEDKIVGQADALTDALYFILGSFVELGVKPYNLFNIVQQSNMSKLFEDEQGNLYPKYREDGKVLKSERFIAPEPKLKEEVERQIKYSK